MVQVEVAHQYQMCRVVALRDPADVRSEELDVPRLLGALVVRSDNKIVANGVRCARGYSDPRGIVMRLVVVDASSGVGWNTQFLDERMAFVNVESVLEQVIIVGLVLTSEHRC